MVRLPLQFLLLFPRQPGCDYAIIWLLNYQAGDFVQANLFDLLILGVVVLSGLAGWRQGLLKAFGGLISTVAAVALALLFSNDLVLVLENDFGLQTALTGFISAHLPVTAISVPMPLSRLTPGGLSTPAQFLSQLLLFIGCFLMIVFLGSRLLQLLFTAFDALVSWGLLGWLNSGLGMAVVVVKNLLIVAIILGILQPAIALGANMDLSGAVWAAQAIHDSWLAPNLLVVFVLMKNMVGLGA